jgi:hypothetical protein
VRAPALLAVVLSQAATPAPPDSSPIPLAPGSHWEYRESYSEQHGEVAATEDTTTRFVLRRGRRGLYVYQSGGADPVSGPVEAGPGWLRVLPWTGEDALPSPLGVGEVGPGSAADHAGWRVEAIEEVAVPAGVFNAFRCAIRTWTHVSVLWITPGVGVVKETHGAPQRRPEIERVLLRWKRAD